MHFEGPCNTAADECERILRSVPKWFGIEESLLEYVADSKRFPTFLVVDAEPVAFLTVREHFPESWEVHCIAVEGSRRSRGFGGALHRHVEDWLMARGALMLQIKTLAASHPSPEYAESRAFYTRMGYIPLEVHPQLWGPRLPVLQLVKQLVAHGAA
jgi:GNAT superfamily N-acetyltransferase